MRIKVFLARLSERLLRDAGHRREPCCRALPVHCCRAAAESEKAVRRACHLGRVLLRGDLAALPQGDTTGVPLSGAFPEARPTAVLAQRRRPDEESRVDIVE